MKKPIKFYFKFFVSVFSLSLFTIGGGYVIVPLMRKKYVEKLKWIKENEMLDLVAVAQSSPGAMAVNTAVLVGYRTCGIAGAVLGAFGAIAPPLIIISLVYLAYDAFHGDKFVLAVLSGIRIGVAAVIIDVVIGMTKTVFKEKNVFSALILLISFVSVYFLKINVMLIIFGCIVIGVVVSLFKRGKNTKSECNEESEGDIS